MKIVLDTNVLVSGLLNPFGAPGEIVRMLGAPEITLCVDARILAVYHEVIRRPRFGIDPIKADEMMEGLYQSSEIYPARPLRLGLPDEDDEPFLAVALAARARVLITGNLKHFPLKARAGMTVLTPAEFITFYKKFRSEAS